MAPELHRELVDDLRRELGLAPPNEAAPAPPPPSPPASRTHTGTARRLEATTKQAARRALAPLAHRVAAMVAHHVVERAELRELLVRQHAGLDDRLDHVRTDIELLRAEIVPVMGALNQLRQTDVALELTRARETVAQVDAATVNLELFKAEVRTIVDRLEELGFAIAPGAGLEGVAPRFAELRERVNALDRRLRQVAERPVAAGAVAAGPTPSAAPTVDHFDYVGFEARFRGESGAILEAQTARYLGLLRDHGPVLDIGCGRGELLEALKAEGVDASGVDLGAEMVAEAQGRGLDVHEADAVEWLRGLPERSLGAIISVHVVEHLELNPLIELLELAASRLVPGGILVAETPNPASLIVLGNSYILDPTHVRPLHPSLMTFLCERAGFRDVRLEFYAPAEAYHLPRVDLPADAPPWATAADEAFGRLNDVLFGPQEYAVVATTPTP